MAQLGEAAATVCDLRWRRLTCSCTGSGACERDVYELMIRFSIGMESACNRGLLGARPQFSQKATADDICGAEEGMLDCRANA